MSGPEPRDPASVAVEQALRVVARSTLRVLLTGPRGVGKSRYAGEIHRWSGRRGPFLVFDCGAVRPDLVEAELFGSVRGAFTGADRDRDGLVDAAAGGTLFLDEVGELSFENQGRLLAFLGSGVYRRVGCTMPRQASIRVVAASHRDLRASLRPELYDRLAERVVAIPALADRPGDVVPLAEQFVRQWAAEEGTIARSLAPDLVEALVARSWPGNVRELSSAIHVGVVEAAAEGSPRLHARHLRSAVVPDAAAPVPDRSSSRWHRQRDELDRVRLLDLLHHHDWRITAVARALGLHRQRVHERMRALGIRRHG
ncbi:MAG: sigma 54-interacting transcriptional regulator [Myxococcota bacterium]